MSTYLLLNTGPLKVKTRATTTSTASPQHTSSVPCRCSDSEQTLNCKEGEQVDLTLRSLCLPHITVFCGGRKAIAPPPPPLLKANIRRVDCGHIFFTLPNSTPTPDSSS